MLTLEVFITFILLCSSARAIATPPPNIIYILADDLGYDDVSYRGNNEFYTENIDALGYNGVFVKHMYTAPLCTPTRGCLLSGQFPIRTGLQHSVIRNEEQRNLPLNVTTLPQLLRKAGYSTNLVGKWHLGMSKKEFTPTFRGFDHHFGYWGSFVDFYTRSCKMPGNGSYGYDFRRGMEVNCDSPNKYLTDVLTDEAERIILENRGTKPLFLMLTHAAPHAGNDDAPLQAPAEDIEKFSYIKDENHRIYAAMVHKLDQSVGRVVAALDNAGMLQNSIIIFSSDNGAPTSGLFSNTGSNWPMRGQKETPWDGGVHTGAVVWSPLFENRGRIFEQPMHVVDWYPTLAKAAGIKLDESLALDGIDLWSQLTVKHSKKIERDMVHYLDDIENVVSYRHGSWKYIKGTTQNGQFDKVLAQRELKTLSPKDYTKEVLNSLTHLSLQKYDKKRLTEKRINSLRKDTGLKCKNKIRRDCNPLVEECLYNIEKDPCEETNLGYLKKHRDLLADLRERVEVYRKNSMPLPQTEDTTFNDPSYHRCLWTTHAEEKPSKSQSTCDSTSYRQYCPLM